MSSNQAIFFKDFKSSFIPHILKEIYIDHVYDKFLLGKKDLTIVDLGANIGLTSLFFKDFADRVVAVEPSKQHISCIEDLIKHNKIDNIEIYPKAISNEVGMTKFYHNPNVTMFSMESTVNNPNDFEEVSTTTVEQMMKDLKINEIDFMKLDLEGSESKVIASEGFQNVADKIKVIVGEWHTWTAMNPDMFSNTFKDLGFKFEWFKNTEATVFSAVKI